MMADVEYLKGKLGVHPDFPKTVSQSHIYDISAADFAVCTIGHRFLRFLAHPPRPIGF